jgi:hypothetical protein
VGEQTHSRRNKGTSGCDAPLSVARMETTMLRCSGLSDCATAKLLPSARVFSPWAASMTAAGASGLVGVFDSERTDIFRGSGGDR